ncbi:MAG: nucleoside monophosphate kinase [Candidatus Nomurabacteria bacterium]|jgi:adenylate kinase|nr:nucleoside monophosphate kinase [Candidatus Nomurabacteria bacterium]
MILLFGPAGSGKSLQGQILAEKYGWHWLSVGQILRNQNDPEINEKLKGGELFDDEFVSGLVHKTIAEFEATGKNMILDGYPRDAWQAQWIIDRGDADKISGAIVLDVPAEELWKRIKGRGRPDDTEAVLKRRWEIFEQNIYSILPLLENENVKITTINGVGEIAEITARIEGVLRDWSLISGINEYRDHERSYGE